jgi:DNA mismatch repair ATPase MutS
MKAFLMFRGRDFNRRRELPRNESALIQDLELNTLFEAMALGDDFLFDVSRSALFSGLNNAPDTILYRQDILRDCLKHPGIVRNIYAIAVDAIEGEKKSYWGFFKRPGAIVRRSVEVLGLFTTMLRRLRQIADEHADGFESEGFKTFFAMLRRELDDDYFARIDHHLGELKFRAGVLVSAELGKGNKGTNYVLRKNPNRRHGWMQRMLESKPAGYTLHVHPRDEAGQRALSELRDKSISDVADVLTRSTDHILGFFKSLRSELAFYLGCLNLHEQLARKGEPVCFPVPAALGEGKLSLKGLYDVCLTLNMRQRVVGNTLNADNKELVIVTGANQGGKSTFLRSIGLAQLMMQAGMFAPAESYCSALCAGLFTHYKREEDPAMESGKLDEELGRMSEIVDQVSAHSVLLCNESFAATNEREGSEIARQIVSALLEKHVRIFFVTHLYDFAHGFYAKQRQNAIFLRAERQADGGRTFRLTEGEPLPTSYGEDLYQEVFGRQAQGIAAKVAPTEDAKPLSQ